MKSCHLVFVAMSVLVLVVDLVSAGEDKEDLIIFQGKHGQNSMVKTGKKNVLLLNNSGGDGGGKKKKKKKKSAVHVHLFHPWNMG